MSTHNPPARRSARLLSHLVPAPVSNTSTSSQPNHVAPLPPLAALPEVREILPAERKKITFPVRELTYLLDGSPEMTQLKERILLEIERDQLFRNDDAYDLTRPEVRERTMAKAKAMLHYLTSESEEITRIRLDLVSLVDPAFFTRIGVHYGLFFGAIRGSATSEQFNHWVSKGILTLNAIGCFAMTELGHGSNVAALETTATFDETADEFVIHTPTLTATKWWIGGAAHSATLSAVFAQLIIKGKRYGVHTFVVPLRDPRDFTTLPGVSITDCGKKMGRDGIDNGAIQFTNVRIPRTNMLMRHTRVSRIGEVTAAPMAQQLAYGALVGGRVSMVMDSANNMKKALTIAIRYAAVRRQFASKPGEPERALLDYPSHQARLLPLLASAYAIHFAAVEMNAIYANLVREMETTRARSKHSSKDGNAASRGADGSHVLEALKETHATSAGLKAFCTWACLSAIETCRQSCGGHGYSAYAGLAGMYADFAVQCTWEGDNTVLMLQTGRYLVSCYKDAVRGQTQPSGVSYLNRIQTLTSSRCQAKTLEQIMDLDVLGDALDAAACFAVQILGAKVEGLEKQGRDLEGALDECSIARIAAAKAHCQSYIYRLFLSVCKKAQASNSPLFAVLRRLCLLHGIHQIATESGLFLETGHVTSQQVSLCRDAEVVLCRELRNEAVGLVDAFGLSDFVINSPLGRYDGDIYRAYFDKIQRAPNATGRPPYWERVLQPLLHAEKREEEEAPPDTEDDF